MPPDGFRPLTFRQTAPPKPVDQTPPAEGEVTRPKAQTPPLTGPALKVLKLTERLQSVIVEETKLLKARHPREAQKLHGEKSRLMVEYREAIGQLKQQEQVLGAKDSHERQHLRDITDGLRDALRDHARIVLRLKSVTEGLVKSVGEEVAKRDRPVVSYGAQAQIAAGYKNRPTSLALNQVI